MAKIVRPISKKGIFVTLEGLNLARQELELLKTKRRQEVADRIQQAREQGDLSENSEYDAAMDEQALLETKIAELEDSLKIVQIISDGVTSDKVVVGSTIRIDMAGEQDEFTIVGRLEADPSKKKISNESPLGASLLGAKAGDIVEISTADLKYSCKVLEIK